MAEAIGLSALGSGSGTFSGGDTIIYDALVNGIGKVVTLSPYSGQNELNHTGYNLLYYVCSGSYASPNAATYGTTYGWLYNMSSFITSRMINIGAGYFDISTSSVLIFKCFTYADASVTCLLLKI